MRSAVGNWWNGLDPNVHGAIIIVAVAAAIILTAGVAAVPLAGTAPGSILMAVAVGAAIGAVADVALYTGITLATGGQWPFEGMAHATAIGALVGGVTAGAGKAFGPWRPWALTGAAVGAQTYFLAAILGMATGTMSREDLSMRDFWMSVGLGAAFGAIGGKYYTPESYWGYKQSPSKGPWKWRPRGVWDQVDTENNLIYRSIYDRYGRKVIGIHMEPGHDFSGPHVHTWTRTTYVLPSGDAFYLPGIRAFRWTDMLRLLW